MLQVHSLFHTLDWPDFGSIAFALFPLAIVLLIVSLVTFELNLSFVLSSSFMWSEQSQVICAVISFIWISSFGGSPLPRLWSESLGGVGECLLLPVDEIVSPLVRFRLRIIMNTPRLSIPPKLENVVTRWNITCGTGPAKAHIPNSAIAHHWIKNAATNSDMAFAARCDARMLAGLEPCVYRILLVSSRILFHVRKYRIMFMSRMIKRGTVVKQMLATTPFTPSK